VLRLLAPQFLYLLAALPIIAVATWFGWSHLSARYRAASMLTRAAIVAALAVALAQPAIEKSETRVISPVFVFTSDISRSTALNEKDARTRKEELVRDLPGDTKALSLCFAATPTLAPGPDDPNPDETNIDAALDYALAVAGQPRNINVVLLSDGRSTMGDPIAAALRIRGAGGSVHVIPVGRKVEGSPAIISLQPPDDARVGVEAHILARVSLPRPGDAAVSLLDTDGRQLSRVDAHLTTEQVVALPVHPEHRGPHRMRVVLTAPEIPGAAAASADVLFHVSGPPSILICDPDPLDIQPLKRIIEQLRFACAIIPPSAFASATESLADYDAVILSDWPTPELANGPMDRLRRFVENGGGLIFVGGTQVATRSWRGSPLEAMLPIDFAPEIAKIIEKPLPVHVCFVLDVSGSMTTNLGVDDTGRPVSKLNMMKQAVIDTLAELPAGAIVSIVVFSDVHQVVLNRLPARQRVRIERTVRDLGVGGGTNMVPAIRAGVDLLKREKISRHMILLTDGVSAENPDRALCDDIRNSDIDLTSIAVGADSNTAVMEGIADATYGRYVHCADAGSIPRVFVKQARAIKTISVLPRKPFHPRLGPQPEILRGLPGGGWPILEAAMPAVPKPSKGVQVALLNGERQPLLAAWSVGLGHVVAFLADAKPVWSRRWLQWPQYERFWARILAYAVRIAGEYRTRADVQVDGGECIALVSVRDANGKLPDDVLARGALQRDAGGTGEAPIQLDWRQLPSGLFRGTALVDPGGQYVCDLDFQTTGGRRVLRWQGVVGSRAGVEMRATGPDESTLRAIAAAGGGIFSPTPEQLAEACRTPMKEVHQSLLQLWPWLVGFALLLWPLDVAFRKLGTM